MFIYIHIISHYKLFLYFNLCLSVIMLNSLSCSFTSISFLTNSFIIYLNSCKKFIIRLFFHFCWGPLLIMIVFNDISYLCKLYIVHNVMLLSIGNVYLNLFSYGVVTSCIYDSNIYI